MSTANPVGQIAGALTLGFFCDPHIPDTNHEGHVQTGLSWLVEQGAEALVCGGDCNGASFFAWVRDVCGITLPVLAVPGNHDGAVPWSGEGPVPPDPFAGFVAAQGWLCQGKEWWHWSRGPVRVIGINNLVDCQIDGGLSGYWNVNPPGEKYVVNPDHSGISDPQSEQWAFLQQAATSGHQWVIVVAHRGVWAPFDASPRPMCRETRAALAGPIASGASLVVTGDQHIGGFTGPWVPDEQLVAPGHGAYALALAGGYAVRQVNPAVLPPGSVHWARGGATMSGIAHFAAVTFGDESAALRVLEVSNADPAGSQVFAATLPRRVV